MQEIIKAIHEHPSLEVKVLLSGALADPTWGDYSQQLLFNNKVHHVFQSSARELSSRGVAETVAAITKDTAFWLEENPVEFLLVLGDRSETFAAVSAAYFMNVVIAHIHGGDRVLTDCLDTNIRHSISKLAHIHFPACSDSKDRLIRLGEIESQIFLAGSPAAELARTINLLDESETRTELGLGQNEAFVLATLHPENASDDANAIYMRTMLEALNTDGMTAVITYPNNDPGGEAMLETLTTFDFSIKVVIRATLGIRLYLSTLKICDYLLGNTSSGITEAPIFQKSFVNVGNRQTGRFRGENVIDCPKYDSGDITDAISHVRDKTFRDRMAQTNNPYDFGGTSAIIANALAGIEITDRLRAKPITY